MPTAFVAGAATPLGRDVISELSRVGVAAIAHLQVDVQERPAWQRKLNFPMVRLDATPWDMPRLTQVMEQNSPSHIFILTGSTQTRARAAKKQGIPEGNYETTDFKKADMLIDAVLRARREAHLVYLSAVGASTSSSDPHLVAMGRGEKKVMGSTCPYTIIRAPFIRSSEGGWWFDTATARTQDVFLSVLGLVGGRAARDRKRSIRSYDLASAIVAIALDPAGRNAVVEGERLRL